MSLSRPLYNFIGTYLEQLFTHPIRTKSITSGVLASSANLASQAISGQKKINSDSILSYGLFGFIFGGTVPHYFYITIERLLAKDMKFRKFFIFLSERLMLAPTFQVLSLYFLSRFEGNEHRVAVGNLEKLYWPLLQANWKFLSLPVFLNIYFVPPMLRVFVANLFGFVWVIYLANKRRKQQVKKTDPSPSGNITRKEN